MNKSVQNEGHSLVYLKSMSAYTVVFFLPSVRHCEEIGSIVKSL